MTSPAAESERPVLGRLELHVTHACNLACESCSHFSNHNHKGHTDPALAEAWMARWAQKIDVRQFVLLGGEPTIHPGLSRFPRLVREHWPHAAITIITNGFFLDRHPDLPKVLAECGNAGLSISVHHQSPEYLQRVKPMVELAERWHREFGFPLEIAGSHTRWTRRYLGYGDAMMPFEDGDARRSWENCPARTCRQLFDGRLWKCSPIAYIRLQDENYKLSDIWRPYLDYRPLDADCTPLDLEEFLGREEESICTMCSAEPRTFELPNPMRRAR